jgi:Fe-S cluster biogenesis protein NfuA
MPDEQLRQRVETVIREKIAPSLNLDGTGIEVIEVDDGIASVRMNGVCSGCPATITVIVHGIEQELRQAVPEVIYLDVIG